MALDKTGIAKRIAQEMKDGYYINLGIGVPTMAANFIPKDINVVIHTENGLLGMGTYPTKDNYDADLVNAGKQTVTSLPGASFFDSSLSFAMIRGGHIDLTVLGAFEVTDKGDIASWKIPGSRVKGMGGAMDLVAAAKNIIVAMTHTNRKGEPKLVKNCTLPLTGVQCVKMIVTDLAVIKITEKGFELIERAPGVSVEEILEKTAAPVIVEGVIPEMKL
ncbi:3-oxoacid CoA-transferase subunit B [Candidatus Cloacimonadota bacterium]